jgi:putative flippase GtrA
VNSARDRATPVDGGWDDGSMAAERKGEAGVRRSERFHDFLSSCTDRLPRRLRRLLPPELLGFGLIGAVTFGIDLALLVLLRHWSRLPLPVAVSVAYVAAFGLNFILNRTVNFRSHRPLGGQILRYAVVVLGDYLLTVGGSTGLAALGLDFRLSRLIASMFVAVFTYSASRWWVFRDRDFDRPEPVVVPVEIPVVAVRDVRARP